jgi:hypothetical protein
MMDDIVERLRVPCIEFGLDEGWIDAERKEAANKIEVLEARIAKVREETLREALDAAREYRYRRGEAVENAILALIAKDKTDG